MSLRTEPGRNKYVKRRVLNSDLENARKKKCFFYLVRVFLEARYSITLHVRQSCRMLERKSDFFLLKLRACTKVFMDNAVIHKRTMKCRIKDDK